MIDYAKKHEEVKHIIFDIIDRMTRNDFDKLKILSLIKDFNKTINFSRTNKILDKNLTPEDVFMLDIEVAVAKKMSNDISRKTQMGMLEKAEQGIYPSTAPLGYKNNPTTKELEVDPQTAPIVTKAFDLYATGNHSLESIRNMLHDSGLRGKRGNKLSIAGIHKMLNNSLYYGIFKWKERSYQGKHKPLISKTTFDDIQMVFKRQGHPYVVTKKNFAFNALMRCGSCDCTVLGEEKKKKYIYYHCAFSKGRHENAPYIPENRLASLFEEPVARVTISEEKAEWLKKILKDSSKDTSELQEKRFSLFESQRSQAKTRLSKLYDLRMDGEIDNEIFKIKEVEYKNNLLEIEAQFQAMRRINPNFYEDGCRTLELSKRLYSLYIRANLYEKAKILKTIASNYTLVDATPYPIYRKPFSIIAKGLVCTLKLPPEDSNFRPGGYK